MPDSSDVLFAIANYVDVGALNRADPEAAGWLCDWLARVDQLVAEHEALAA